MVRVCVSSHYSSKSEFFITFGKRKRKIKPRCWFYKRHPAPPRVAPPYFVDESLDYLDRHETGKGCEDFGGVMSAFELSSEECSMMKPKEMEMRYTCESGGWPKDSWATSCTRHYTEYNEIGSKAIEYLDRHDVVCPDGSALRDWKIQMEGKGRVVYSCCNAITTSLKLITPLATSAGRLPSSLMKFAKKAENQLTGSNKRTSSRSSIMTSPTASRYSCRQQKQIKHPAWQASRQPNSQPASQQ